MASFAPSSILLFGATGNIGRHITNSILESNPPFKRVVVFTSPNTVASKDSLLSAWKAKGLEVAVGDLTQDDDVQDAYRGIDTVISCVGRSVLDRQIRLLTLAEESPGVQWFFPSEYGTDINFSPASASEKPHQVKLSVRKHIRDKIHRLKYTYLVTGPYADMWFNPSPGADAGGYTVEKKTASVIDDGNGRIGLITMKE